MSSKTNTEFKMNHILATIYASDPVQNMHSEQVACQKPVQIAK